VKETSTLVINKNARPLCPRDNSTMHYEAGGVAAESKAYAGEENAPWYRCGRSDCGVHFSPSSGYFTVVNVLEHLSFVDEPGANLLQCPLHGTWLYRCSEDNGPGDKFVWRCGVRDCDYIRTDVRGTWLRE
jgi:hypothetical protein